MNTARIKRFGRPRRGIALIWTAIMGLVLIGLMGLTIDTGYVYLAGRQLQDAADAAALAGAINVSTGVSNAQTAANTIALANKAANTAVHLSYTSGANDTTKDIIVGVWTPGAGGAAGTFTATTTSPNAVKIIARRTSASGNPINLFFGPIFGVNTADVSRTAIAHAGVAGVGAGLLLLGTTGTDINLNNATLSAGNASGSTGGIYVNSNGTGSNVAVKESSNSTIIASDLYVHGTSSSLQLSGTFAGTSHTGADVLPDPLASLAAPSTPITNIQTNTWTTATTISPGWYKKGIKVAGGTLTLSAGIYYIGDGSSTVGFDMNNTAVVASSGVMLYIDSGPFKFPSGSLNISPPSSGAYAGVSIFQSRSNAAQATINGSAIITLNGALYFPDNNVTLTGSGGVQSTGNQIIANSLTMTGGTFNLLYNGTTAFKSIPGSNKPYLVK